MAQELRRSGPDRRGSRSRDLFGSFVDAAEDVLVADEFHVQAPLGLAPQESTVPVRTMMSR